MSPLGFHMVKTNRYHSLISKVFFDGYRPGETSFEFAREDFEIGAKALGITLPKNLGDVIYSMRFRTALPDEVLSTAAARNGVDNRRRGPRCVSI